MNCFTCVLFSTLPTAICGNKKTFSCWKGFANQSEALLIIKFAIMPISFQLFVLLSKSIHTHVCLFVCLSVPSPVSRHLSQQNPLDLSCLLFKEKHQKKQYDTPNSSVLLVTKLVIGCTDWKFNLFNSHMREDIFYPISSFSFRYPSRKH